MSVDLYLKERGGNLSPVTIEGFLGFVEMGGGGGGGGGGCYSGATPGEILILPFLFQLHPFHSQTSLCRCHGFLTLQTAKQKSNSNVI